MTTAAPSTALATIQPAFTDAERLALAGYLVPGTRHVHDLQADGCHGGHDLPQVPLPFCRPRAGNVWLTWLLAKYPRSSRTRGRSASHVNKTTAGSAS